MKILRSEIEKSSWFDKSQYPFESRFCRVTAGELHYVDEGKGDVVVLVHGTPSWSYEFRHLILELRKSYRCIAIDLLGFGLSERPEGADFSVAAQRKAFTQFIEKLGVQKFSLVVTDFGGPIALPSATARPERIQRLVISNSWYWPFEAVDASFANTKRWVDNALMKFLYLRMGFSAKFLAKAAWGKHRALDKKTHASFHQLFPSYESRLSTWAFAKDLVSAEKDFPAFEIKLKALQSIPTLLLWGGADSLIKKEHLSKWQQLLPSATTSIMEKVGHFPFEEAPELTIPAVLSFLSE